MKSFRIDIIKLCFIAAFAAVLLICWNSANIEPKSIMVITEDGLSQTSQESQSLTESTASEYASAHDSESVRSDNSAAYSSAQAGGAHPDKNTSDPPPSGKININTASLEELMSLTGIGEVKGMAIIEYREQYGGFTDIYDLLNVSGIGEKTLEKIKDRITI